MKIRASIFKFKSEKNISVLAFSLFMSTFFILGCQKVLEFDEDEIEPMLVVNCMLQPDSSVSIDLTRSVSALETELFFPVVKDASVSFSDGYNTSTDFDFVSEVDSLYSNYYNFDGNPIFVVYEKGNYVNSQIKIEPGRKYQLKVSAEGFDDVTAETEIPFMVGIDKLDTFSVKVNDNFSTMNERKASLKFTDPVGDNFYRIKVENASMTVSFDPQTGEISYLNPYSYTNYITSNDPVFGYNTGTDIIDTGSGNRFGVFTDQLFDGKQYDIEFTYTTDYQNYEAQKTEFFLQIYRVSLVSLSRDYYYYLKTVDNQTSSGYDLFSDPVLVYTNIKNGTGILGGSAEDKQYVLLSDLPNSFRALLPFANDESLFDFIKKESGKRPKYY